MFRAYLVYMEWVRTILEVRSFFHTNTYYRIPFVCCCMLLSCLKFHRISTDFTALNLDHASSSSLHSCEEPVETFKPSFPRCLFKLLSCPIQLVMMRCKGACPGPKTSSNREKMPMLWSLKKLNPLVQRYWNNWNIIPTSHGRPCAPVWSRVIMCSIKPAGPCLALA